jgi:2-dehydropantoate 2-reductase
VRILVVGAGAIGGYLGGRLLQAGRDVTFLVRPRPAAELARIGLAIRSRFGDINLSSPPTISEHALKEPFNLLLLSSKAYDLSGAMASSRRRWRRTRPYCHCSMACDIWIRLGNASAKARVLGGQCVISATPDAHGRILHLNDTHSVTVGEQDGSRSARVEAIAAELSGTGFESHLSAAILQEMWEKWVFIAAGAGISCLMRASIGDIVSAGAADLATALFDECALIADANGFAPRSEFVERMRPMFAAPGSPLTASMVRDVERGAPTEADHILGDLLHRASAKADTRSLLRIAYAHVRAYEVRRARDQK